MFLLALYPGSGDTYISNLLNQFFQISAIPFEGIESENVFCYKTQQHPDDIPQSILDNRKVVLLIRDGRDCVLNNAYYRYNTITKDTLISTNINNAIAATNGSHFKGWSKHVEAWIEKATIIIRFEDLVENLPRELKRLSDFFNVKVNEALSFYDFRYNQISFGDHKMSNEITTDALVPESWTSGLGEFQKALFLKYHISTLVKLSYCQYENIKSFSIQEYYPAVYRKLGITFENKKHYKILIESSKLCMPYNDGTKRYVVELIKAIKEITKENPIWDIQIFDSNSYQSINDFDIAPYLNIVQAEQSKFIKIKAAFLAPIKQLLSACMPIEYYLTITLKYKLYKAKIRNNATAFVEYVSAWFAQKKCKSSVSNTQQAVFSSARFDLVHIPLLQHAEFILQAKEKALITIHDLTHLSHPQFHQPDNIALANYGLELSMKQQAGFFSISQSTENDFINKFDANQHLDTILEAADNTVFCPLESTYWKDNIRAEIGLEKTDEFFLSVSTLEPRKNLKNAIIAFQKAIPQLPTNVYFVVVGKQGWKMKDVLPEINEISNRIIFTGFMPELYLPWLYREALALIYISHYEGFGLPILEAMSCKTPVIFGNNSSMIEVVGDSGYPVDSENVDDICKSIVRASNNFNEREEKSLQALIQSNKFHWQKTAIQTLELYKSRVESLSKQ